MGRQKRTPTFRAQCNPFSPNAMLPKVNLRHLEAKPLHLAGEITVPELELDAKDELVQPRHPLHYDVDVQKLGHAVLAQGRLEMALDCECARCLKPILFQVELPEWSALLPLEGDEKVAVKDDSVDLTPYMREDILLEFPQHPLCEADCAGLPNRVAENTNGQGGTESSTWAALNKLKLK